MSDVKLVRARDVFTIDEFRQMREIVSLSRLDGKPAAPEIAERVIKPILSRIEAKVGGEVDVMGLAYATEHAINTFLDNPDVEMVATEVAGRAFPTGPIN